LPQAAWSIPIQRTIATDGTGVPELAKHIQEHLRYLRHSGKWATREGARLTSEVEAILGRTLRDQFHARLPEGRYNEVMRRVLARELSPWEAVGLLTDGAVSAASAEGSPARVKSKRARDRRAR
jgi:LAO/AO transport system kinase